MIEVRGLCKSFEKHQVLNDLDLNLGSGSVYGLVGINGAGKTTLLKLLTGIYRKDAGKISIFEEEVYENPNVKQRIVFIPDELFFFNQYSIRETADFYKKAYPAWDEERFCELQSVFGIDLKRRVSKLSKGMKRQVAFWVALSIRPDLLIMDEPLDGLDPMIRSKVKKLMLADVAERNSSILISSHNLRELEDICDHIGILHGGKIIVERDIDDLKSGVRKVQVVFNGDFPEDLKNSGTILYSETRGSVNLLIMRGEEAAIKEKLLAYKPLLVDMLPLTFEEIFVYEMGGAGYDISNII